MKMTWTEELTLSLARSATGKAGDGQILALLLAAVAAGTSVRAEVDLGLVLTAACLIGVLAALERRQFYAIVKKLEQAPNGSVDHAADGRTV